MNKSEAKHIWQKAQSEPWNWDKIKPFEGISFHHGPRIPVTVEQAAAFIRFQSLYLNGDWDQEELQDCWYILRHKTLILD